MSLPNNLPPLLTCTRRLTFCAGHRVMGHENKCAHLHGHNYVVYATAKATPLADPTDPQGRVIDFSVIKERLNGWLDSNWDHGFILHADDIRAKMHVINFGQDYHQMNESTSAYANPRYQKLYTLPYNPTAENIAKYLLTEICPDLFEDTFIEIVEITIEETENCKAAATLATSHPPPHPH